MDLKTRDKKTSKVHRGDDFHLYLALNKVANMFKQYFRHSFNRSKILQSIEQEKTRLRKNYTRNESIGTSKQENVLELEQELDSFEKGIEEINWDLIYRNDEENPC